jgi:putative hydrolase of the HAD superfamily
MTRSRMSPPFAHHRLRSHCPLPLRKSFGIFGNSWSTAPYSHALYNLDVTPRIEATRRPAAQTLLIDADDTLWENNIYFERAISAFISYLDHRVHTPEEVRSHLNSCEHATVKAHGYGLQSFRRSLIDCFEQLTDAPLTPEKHTRIVNFAQSIADQEIELLPHVAPTLADLATRHRLILVTKGNHEEQTDKLHRSGLAPHFSAIEVLPEKHPEAYLSLVAHHDCQPSNTWMIGNSPKSDINPALAAGLHAIFIPHDFTWVLEHEVVNQPPTGQTLLELPAFADLAVYF